jgi:hypothetical protein
MTSNIYGFFDEQTVSLGGKGKINTMSIGEIPNDKIQSTKYIVTYY